MSLLALLATSFAGGTVAAQSTITFSPSADTYGSATYPTTNFGTATTLRVDGSPDVRSFLRFSVSGLGGQSITQATLQIYANSSASAGLTAQTISDNSWGETTLNYNNMPAMGASIASSGAAVAGNWTSMDVTSYITGEGTYSFRVITPGSTAISLASRESGTNAPKLILTLGGSSSTPTATDTPSGGTSTPTTTDTPSSSTPTPTGGATATPTSPAPSGAIQHVFVIVMENKGYTQVWNKSSTPYITQLGKSYIRATNYYAITHPSLPNYLDLVAGNNFGITTDCNPSASCHVSDRSIADSLEAKGLSWKAYMESMPGPCYLTVSGNYAPKHDPFVYFDDIRNDSARCNSHVVNFSALSGDLGSGATTPNFAFISADQCNDMHDCSISTGDTWLKNHVPDILSSPSCTSAKCLVVITWDEDNNHYGNHVLTIFAGSGAQTGGGTSSTSYTHYSLLRTVEDIFGLGTLTSNDAAASSMSDMLR